jgi:very-short-patch-repair endonuclease
MKKYTTGQFVEIAKKIHMNKYCYEFSNYKNSQKKIKILCKEHGIFEQKPYAHLNGQGCPKCNKYHGNNVLEFIIKSNIIHNNKYNYSFVEYINSKNKVKIICPIHGEFEQSPCRHVNLKQGCPKCGRTKKLTNIEFIERAINIHKNIYDYSLVEYKNFKTKVNIICKKHGVFKQSPNAHLNGSICPKCSLDKSRKFDRFLNISKTKYGDKYDYSLTTYKRCDEEVKIICPKHGIFEQRPDYHLKRGCPICEGNMKVNTEQIKIIFNEIHDNEFDYSLVEYKGDKIKVKIICPKHGVFEQTPSYHKIGSGCPICNESSGEKNIRKFLKFHKINFKPQKKFYDCRDIHNLIYDFYLPDKNICIEYNGEQHYNVNVFFGGIKRLKDQQKKDKIKEEYCKNNGIKLIKIKYDDKIEEKLNFLV